MQLVAAGLSHRHADQESWLLSDVSLTISSPGRSIAIMGPSGSGKTTLLSLLGGLLRPLKGTVHVEGGSPNLLENVSWIHQAAHGLSRRTALDNVVIGGLARGESRQAMLGPASDLLTTVGLGHRRTARAKTLSGGELQRLAVARALARGAPFLLADEPTGQLDEATGAGVLDALFSGTDRGLTVVVATHDPLVAERCDEVVEIRNGTTRTRPSG